MNKFGQKAMTKTLLAIYLVALTWIIVFKMQLNPFSISRMPYRRMNLVPFAASVITNGKIRLDEIILNVVVFMPFGVYVSLLKEKWNFLQKTAPVFFTSLAYELIQYVFAIGACDITDLLGNTFGGVIGIAVIWLLSKFLKDNTIKAVNIIAAIGTFLAVMLFGIIIFANL